jgi:deoxyribodipyrimidine photolyase-related protein
MTVGVRILGDQLWQNQAALNRTDYKSSLPVILIESWQHVQQHRYHRQKLVLIWSAMPHFAAEELRGGGCQVTYTTSGDFEAPLKAWIQAHNITEVRVMTPNARPFLQLVQNLQLPCQTTLIPNNQFL